MASTNKWHRDPMAEGRYADWYFGNPNSDEQPIAVVGAHWRATRATGQGKPDGYRAVLKGIIVGTFATIREATKAIDTAMAVMS